MRKILFAWALLSLPVMMLAQKPGTLDQDFANGGHYSFAVTGSQAWLNFMTYRYESNASEPGWALLLGGNIYKNYVYDGIFTTEITQDGELNQWAGKPATDLTDIQDAIYLPGGGFMAVGSADIGGNHNAKVSQFNGPGEVNSNFGVSGSITLDNQTGADYAHDICYNNSDPDNPFYMVVGSTMNAGNMQKTAWWMLGPDGQLNNDFGANGMYVPATGGETAWLNDVVSFGNKVVAAGTIDYLAYIKILDPNTMISGSLLFPSSSDPDHIYEYFSVIPEGDHFFASGYHYDMGSYKSNEFVRGVDSEPFAFNDGISDILNTGVSNVESQVNGFSTGIHSVFPAQAGPGGMKTDGPSPMVIIGSIIIGSEEETSFVAAINADGSLADDFGTNGV
ncbi:MAG: hypothetical protein HOG34_09825, partial [Bacteroidetes bacterium]|nr:hypothetical protein [Bacteroidota bacterium]